MIGLDLLRRQVGTTGVSVSCLGFGGGALGGMNEPVLHEDAVAAVRRAYELGIRYFDTAPLYGHGRSEERVGEALAGRERAAFCISSKVGVRIEPRPGRTPELERRYADPYLLDGAYDFSYDGVMRSLEGSLKRLGTDYVDIAYIHDPDEADSALPPDKRSGADHFGTVMNGAYRALEELRAQGVVRAIGVGLNGTELLTRFATAGDFDAFLLAGRYTLLEQGGMEDLFPLCRENRISLVVGGVYNSGILATGAADPAASYDYAAAPAEILARVGGLEEVCSAWDVPLPAAALRFPLGDEIVAAVIPGMRSVREVEAAVELVAQAIPEGFWRDLASRGFIDPQAELPSRSPVNGATA